MKNYRVKLSYRGTNYHGFQRQNNAMTVQQAVEDALSALLGENVTIYGCSRTDAGVHAREFYFSFKTNNPIPPRGIIFGTNARLSDDIALMNCEEMPPEFHARYSCRGKEYEYLVYCGEIRDPFLCDGAYRLMKPLDAWFLNREAQAFVGEHDFRSFCAADCEKENTTRTIYSFNVTQTGRLYRFRVAGNGFLYNMVRIMVGTLICINEGKLESGAIERLLQERDRTLSGRTVPPQGLYLDRVFYDDIKELP